MNIAEGISCVMAFAKHTEFFKTLIFLYLIFINFIHIGLVFIAVFILYMQL